MGNSNGPKRKLLKVTLQSLRSAPPHRKHRRLPVRLHPAGVRACAEGGRRVCARVCRLFIFLFAQWVHTRDSSLQSTTLTLQENFEILSFHIKLV